MVEGTNNNE